MAVNASPIANIITTWVASGHLAVGDLDGQLALLLGAEIAEREGNNIGAANLLDQLMASPHQVPETNCLAALILFRLGRVAQAEQALRAAIDSKPDFFDAAMRLGDLLVLTGRLDEAVACYERAAKINPGHAAPFSKRTAILLRRAWGEPLRGPASAPSDVGKPPIAMSTLGQNGRFGNQLLQYGFLRGYAAKHGLRAEAPDWPGRYLYDLDDPYPSQALEPAMEHDLVFAKSLAGETPEVFANRDLWGYFCYPTRYYRPHRELFRSIFRPGRHIAPTATMAMRRLRERGQTVVALHLRRGDFGYNQFWIAPESWYLAWLDRIWGGLDRPVLFLASDEPEKIANSFRRFQPVIAADLVAPVPGAEFFVDFHVLTQADLVGISNSSFSFVASMLNERARGFMRPDPVQKALIPYDPWDADVLLRTDQPASAT